jgi:hypothetical protein
MIFAHDRSFLGSATNSGKLHPPFRSEFCKRSGGEIVIRRAVPEPTLARAFDALLAHIEPDGFDVVNFSSSTPTRHHSKFHHSHAGTSCAPIW